MRSLGSMKGGKAGKPVAWRLQGKLAAKPSHATTAIAMPRTPERPECSPDTDQPAQAPAMRVPPPSPAPATVRVVSPCVRQCTLNEQDFCMGCGRALADITAWMAMSDEDKTACIERGRANLARIGRPLPPYPPYPLTPVAPRRR
jgi:predicted Fe-S protein YdhL (DUF1289 family)